jgi:hypothetical protein
MNWYRKSQTNYDPLQMTEDEFVDYHKTGWISSDAYEQYRTIEGLSWIKKEKSPILYSVKQFGDKTIEFRKTGEKLFYCKTDEDGDIVRDKDGQVVYLTDEEMIAKGLPMQDTTITAFDGDVAIGWVSNEFGTDGVWVVDDYQFMGIGLYLLKEFRKQFRPERRIGQMTDAGENMTRAYYRDLVREQAG